MKAKVIKRFRDKHTKKAHNLRTFYEGSEERIQELQGFGWLGEVEKEIVDHTEGKFISKLKGTVDEIKISVDGLKKSDYEKLIEVEGQGKNRKSLIEFFQAQAKMAALVEPPNGEGE